ncbi:MAG: trigger factor [Candidatus Cloacimonetes bacterium]|nr:trigger factor [Candidatus Cloacimonadota bacterium]
MKTEISIIDQITRELIVTIDEETYKKDYQNALKKFSKKVQIDGFRKGKAPLSTIERLYGPNIKEFYIEEFGNIYYKNALEETKSEPIDAGSLEDIIFEESNEVTFKFKFECLPVDFEYDYKDLEVEFEPTEFNDTILEQAINDILNDNTEIVPFDENDEIQLNNTIYLLDKEHDTEYSEIVVAEDNSILKDLNIKTNDVLGLKINSEFDVDGVQYQVIDAFKSIVPELTEELAKALNYDSIEGMKQSVKDELLKNIEQQNKSNLTFAIVNAFGNKNKENMKIPQSYLIRVGQQSVRQQLGNMQGINELPEFGDDFYLKIAEHQIPNIIWDLSYDKIAKDNNIEVTEEDIETKIIQLAEQFKLSADEFKTKYVNHLNYIKEDLLVEKIIDFIKPLCKISKPKKQETKQETEVSNNEETEFEVIPDNNEE